MIPRYSTRLAVLIGAVPWFCSPGAEAATVTYYTTEHYYGRADSPFYAGIQAGTIYLEDFEHLPFMSPRVGTPYVSASAGTVAPSAGKTVDEDDGLDGIFQAGYAWQYGRGGDAGLGLYFEFARDPQGRLPEYAGLALLGYTTDAGRKFDTSILIYDAEGNELTGGTFLSREPYYPSNFPPGTGSRSSIGDRFVGAYVEGGISRIQIFGYVPVDHLQYGYAIPEPSAFLLTGLSLTFLLRRPSGSGGRTGGLRK